jgi:hypothetical protein
MTTAAYVLLTVLAVAVLAVVLVPLVRAWWKARGARLVTCPENQEPVRVEIDPLDAAFHEVFHTPSHGLKVCSRWPEKAGCGQECLIQIESAPNGCLVHGLLANWYADKSCALCGKAFGHIEAFQHKPAFLDAEGVTREWAAVRVEDLPRILETNQPVCWDCHIHESFLRTYPELVTFRDPHPSHYRLWEV